jgi:glycosyltransferase involved in cell wall biosynthesis
MSLLGTLKPSTEVIHGRTSVQHGRDSSGPLIISSILRGDGITGVDTHIRQVRAFLEASGTPSTLVTPFSWGRPLTYPVFGFRSLALQRLNPAAGVAWYLHWHEVFVGRALRRSLAEAGPCVVYAQDPFVARQALRVRRGPHQRVVMAVHLRTSMADEWADKQQIPHGGRVFRWIRQVERTVIPQVNGLVFVSRWARDALLGWLPEAGAVPFAVVNNFVTPWRATAAEPRLADLVTVGNLDLVKNHRFLLQVLAEAKRAGRTISLDIFGEGPCRNDLELQAESLGLSSQVRLRGYRRDVRESLPRYSAYVHASYSESSSLAIIEAMAAGLPIVAGDIGPIAELCEQGKEARFWPLDDPARAAAMIIELLDCEPSRLTAARASLERFHQRFDADVVGPQLVAFLLGAPAPSLSTPHRAEAV